MNFNVRKSAKDSAKVFPKVLKKDTAVHVLFEESAQRHHLASEDGDVAVHDTSPWRAVSLLDVVPCQLVDTCLKQLTGLSLNGKCAMHAVTCPSLTSAADRTARVGGRVAGDLARHPRGQCQSQRCQCGAVVLARLRSRGCAATH